MTKYYQNRTQEQVTEDRISLMFMMGLTIVCLTVWGLLLLLELVLIG